MNIFWLQQTEADLPEENHWLTQDELLRLEGMRFPKRRHDWRLGRWTAKCTVAAYFRWNNDHETLANIEIRTATSGAPQAWFAAKPAPISISISHRAGLAMCAVALAGVSLGCDLESVEPRSDLFIADYFTIEEQLLLGQTPEADRTLLVTLLWSAKESTLKALQEGLRLDTRSVVVGSVDLAGYIGKKGEQLSNQSCGESQYSTLCRRWHRLQVTCTSGQYFDGWYQCAGQFARTIVATPLQRQPVFLDPFCADWTTEKITESTLLTQKKVCI